MAKREPRRVEVAFDRGVGALEPPGSFLEACAGFGIEFEAGEVARLGRFLALLLEANRAFNLTSVTEPEEAWRRHVFDSLTLLPLLSELPDGAAVADVGSGGGLPGVPLAVCLPRLELVLIEATGKKVGFLRIVVEELGLRNVEVVQGRAEEVGRDQARHRGMYDAVVARAVGRLAVIAELCVPLAAAPQESASQGPGGRVLLIKGQRAEEELEEGARALEMLGAAHAGTVKTPTGKIVVLEKTGPTDRRYPRRSGEPKKSPLGTA